jgi:hypothetical protein
MHLEIYRFAALGRDAGAMVVSPFFGDMFRFDQRSVITCDDRIAVVEAGVGLYVSPPEGIEALVNGFLYFISDLRRLLCRRRLLLTCQYASVGRIKIETAK